MGLFKDFATSGYGDVTVGALQGLSEVGQRDAEKNAVFANDSLNKENESMKLTELAFKNKKQITNIIANNPLAFGITESGDLNTSQIADRLTNKIFNEQRTIFESNNFDTVKIGVAKYLTRPGNLGEGITLSNPYIPSEDKFQAEKDKHAAKLSEISKTPRVDKLLMNLETAEQSVPEPEAITDALTKVASITAKGYGILNTFPGTPEGNTNLKFMQTNIIVANARSQFPNNANERNNFITKKLYDNNIDPMAAISFQSPLTYKQITSLLDSQSSALANKILENTNAMAQAQNNEERVQIQNQTNQIIMEQYRLLNTYSQSAGQILSGRDRDMKPPVTVPEEITPPVKTPTPDVSEEIEKESAEPEKAGEIGAFQASLVKPVALASVDKFTNQIIRDEGKPFLKATKVFDDEKNFTIGYGRNNASIKEGDTITKEQAEKNLAEDVEVRLEEIQDLIPNFANISEPLQIALFSEYYRGSVRQSPKTVALINQGRFQEAAAEFLNNDEYRNAVKRKRKGIRERMLRVVRLLQREGTTTSPAV